MFSGRLRAGFINNRKISTNAKIGLKVVAVAGTVIMCTVLEEGGEEGDIELTRLG